MCDVNYCKKKHGPGGVIYLDKEICEECWARHGNKSGSKLRQLVGLGGEK